MQPGILQNALQDRGDGGQCNMPRIPTGRYPAFSTTLRGAVLADGTLDLALEAERDYLFIGLSVSSSDPDDNAGAFVDAEYCNTKYLVHSAMRAWQPCCDRKPVFLVGVRENKDLRFHISGATPAAIVKVTLHGFQGAGCCG